MDFLHWIWFIFHFVVAVVVVVINKKPFEPLLLIQLRHMNLIINSRCCLCKLNIDSLKRLYTVDVQKSHKGFQQHQNNRFMGTTLELIRLIVHLNVQKKRLFNMNWRSFRTLRFPTHELKIDTWFVFSQNYDCLFTVISF